MDTLLTSVQMRAIEQAAIASGSVTGLALMERAGRGVVEAILHEWPALARTAYRAVVLCGPGNNGGDGFVIARLLHQRGWHVELFFYGELSNLPSDARVNYDLWSALGQVKPWDVSQITQTQADIYIDAVFGTGLNREPDDMVMEAFTQLYTSGKSYDKMVAVDLPTGLCADSGRDLCVKWGAVYAFLTVTFHSYKLGHILSEGEAFCAKAVLCDIGLNKLRTDDPQVVTFAEPNVADLSKRRGDHKFSHGHAVVVAGGVGQGGAARLAARGALRVGAGVVTLVCPSAALAENAARLDAIMLKAIKDAADFDRILQDERINALCLGPGLGLGPCEAGFVDKALQSGRNLVLDADALTLLARDPDLFDKLHAGCILTPHAGEFARLFPEQSKKFNMTATNGPAYSKVDAARAAAEQSGCVVVFKGPDTVIAAPSGHASVSSSQYEHAAPWLATAGSGDVLAGIITGLLARGFETMEAAKTGTWLHREAARAFGPGLIAEDIPEELPKVFRDLGLW